MQLEVKEEQEVPVVLVNLDCQVLLDQTVLTGQWVVLDRLDQSDRSVIVVQQVQGVLLEEPVLRARQDNQV